MIINIANIYFAFMGMDEDLKQFEVEHQTLPLMLQEEVPWLML